MSGGTFDKFSLSVGDVEIGAIEIKDNATDTRAKVVDLSTLFPSLPPNTYYGLIIGGEVAVVNDANSPFKVQTILDPVNVLANSSWIDVNAVVRQGFVTYFLYEVNVATDIYLPVWSAGYPYGEILVNNVTIQVKNNHTTNGLIFMLEGSVNGVDYVNIVTDRVLAAQEQAIIHIADEKWLALQLKAKRQVAGQDSIIRGAFVA